MTGFGATEGRLAGGRLAIEVRTVNHRHLNVTFRLPAGLQHFEAELRDVLRRRIARGSVTVTARWTEEPPRTPEVRVDVARARSLLDALAALKRELDLPGEIDLAFIARQPDVLALPDREEVEVEWDEARRVFVEALEAVVAMREREGAALSRDVTERIAAIEQLLDAVAARAPQRRTAEQERLRRAASELLAGQTVDEQRLAQEVALYADRVDIQEELVRLRTHLVAARDTLAGDGTVGRRLAFLGQEMLREVNTIGSKANDAEIARHVIQMKEEVERLREQVENLE